MSAPRLCEMAIPPVQSLPLDPFWPDEDTYVHSLLSFATESDLFRNLCGGVHILDFLTREPDLYSVVLPQEWRDWFDQVDVHDVLQLLLREDLDALVSPDQKSWNGGPMPPKSLLNYAITIRRHSLVRKWSSKSPQPDANAMPRRLAGGMKPKKVHEVQHFSAYVDRLSAFVTEETGEPVSGLVDFGSGQNYLGRTLVSPPYHQDVIAIERRHHNVSGAKRRDVSAKLAKKEKIMRNKKEYKKQLMERISAGEDISAASSLSEPVDRVIESVASGKDGDIERKGSITYIEHDIENGQIEDIIYPPDCIPNTSSSTSPSTSTESLTSIPPSSARATPRTTNRPNLMVISLHSCGNLSHHGLRTLNPTLNPSISAIALIGCCYNLLTERLGPTTYKHPVLRPHHPRLEATGSAYDPHGFPMSKTLENYPTPDGSPGVRLNITARMMAVQAPYNWGQADSEAFFTRHFYRALLQRMLLDVGIVQQSSSSPQIAGGSLSGRDEDGTPLIIGSLRKSAFASFSAYVHAAMEKLAQDPDINQRIHSKSAHFSEATISSYEADFAYARKRLAVTWSLMAFSAGVVESIIVVDRWLWLREQKDWVGRCWVAPVFDYACSPRNLVVVGIRKRRGEMGKEHRQGLEEKKLL